MRIRPRIALVVIAVAALTSATLAAGSPAAALPSQPSSPPAGFQRIVDDTGTVAISVPTTWSLISTTPVIANDRTVLPTIYAAQPAGIDAFPSLTVAVEPYRTDARVTEIAWCQGTVEPYAFGPFTGERGWFTGCEGGLLYQDIVVSPAGEIFTVRVSFAYESAEDEPTLDAVAQSLEMIATEYPPPSATGPVGCLMRCHEAVASESAGGVSPPPAVVAEGEPIWPYGPIWNVPSMGTEPVLGSGCGSQGQIGDLIPDGLWAGYVTNEDAAVLDIDLLCIYTGAAAQHVIDDGTANIVGDDSSYLIVNNNTRLRQAPAAPGIVLRDSAVIDGSCVEDPSAAHVPTPPRQAWVRIDGGVVTWILWGCGQDSPAVPTGAQQAELPPAYPDYSDGVGSVWPYGTFHDVPQLGLEPARGSGCGASGQLGATIPDGLWAGFVTGYDAATNVVGIDVLCVFSGATAEAVVAEGTANVISDDPNFLVVNNNPQVRTMPSGLAAIVVGELTADGQCVEGTHLSPEAVDEIAARTTQQAWVRVDGGLVTWVFYGC